MTYFFLFQVRILIGQENSIYFGGYFCKPLYHTCSITQTAKGIVCTTKLHYRVRRDLNSKSKSLARKYFCMFFLKSTVGSFENLVGPLLIDICLYISGSAKYGWAMAPLLPVNDLHFLQSLPPCCRPFSEP